MRKIAKYALLLVGAALVLAGCGEEVPPDEKMTLDDVKTAYEQTADATVIANTIEVKVTANSLVQYTRERTYTLEGSAYTVTEESKTLNSLEAEEAYTLASDTFTATKAETFGANLVISGDNLQNVTFGETKVTASVKAGREDEFLSVQSFAAEVTGMKVEFTLGEDGLAAITVTFVSGLSSVTVATTYSY